jgi:hypothetical protein
VYRIVAPLVPTQEIFTVTEPLNGPGGGSNIGVATFPVYVPLATALGVQPLLKP